MASCMLPTTKGRRLSLWNSGTSADMWSVDCTGRHHRRTQPDEKNCVRDNAASILATGACCSCVCLRKCCVCVVIDTGFCLESAAAAYVSLTHPGICIHHEVG